MKPNNKQKRSDIMKSKINESQLTKENQILKMTIKIMERYNVLNSKLATSVATSLYENGIGLDKFHEKYYSVKTPFYLDEIVLYLLKKQIKKEKTINYQEYLASKKDLLEEVEFISDYPNFQEKSAEIIKYKPKVRKKDQNIDFRYYYKERN